MSQESKEPIFVPSPEYLARQKRLDDAVNLRRPDRIPVAPLVVHFYPTKIKGISNKDAQYNLELRFKVWQETIVRYNWDAALLPDSIPSAGPLEILGAQQIKWPGGALPDNQPFQWVEGEYMRQDEYDEVLSDPNGFAVQKLWPRVAKTLAPISAIFENPPPLLYMSNAYTLPPLISAIVSQPPVWDSLQKIIELKKEIDKNNTIIENYMKDMKNLGYPFMFGGVTFTAFDWISDTLRGLRGTMLDMYQVPDKLLALINMFIPLTIHSTAMMAKQANIKAAFIPLHRGADNFMSDQQFAKFYWPSLKALILGLIDEGVTPVPFFEGIYTNRLDFLAELPPRKVLGHFDRIDRRKAKEKIGNVMCFWGNVQPSLMCMGTPGEVEEDVKELIDIFGDNGGLIIDSSIGLPDESKPENVEALTEAVFKYGVS